MPLSLTALGLYSQKKNNRMKVWSGKLDCTFHGKMHWELNKEIWFLSKEAKTHHDTWKEMGVKITEPKSPEGYSKVYAPKGYDTDLASIPRFGWVAVAPWDVARPAIIHDVLYGVLRDALKNKTHEDFLKQCLDEAGICVLHAPLFHPAMKNVAPIRRSLGVKTFFNMLGPMVNPAFPKNQLVGVFDLELARMYGYLYQKSKRNYAVLHAIDGYDEISLTGPVKIISRASEHMFQPKDLGLRTIEPQEIHGGDTVPESAEIFQKILKGKGSEAQNNVVCANAGLAIAVAQQITMEDGFKKAQLSLASGQALKSLEKLQQLSKAAQ